MTTEDLYGECPIAPEGFEYDREHYLSSRYAAYIDEEITKSTAKLKLSTKLKLRAK